MVRYMLDLSTIPFRQARWYTAVPPATPRVIGYVVLHDMEFPERPDSAEWCMNFFATSDRVGSTHVSIDSDSICRSVLDKDVCYGANGVNRNGLHIEHAGYASQSEADWSDAYSMAMLKLSASLTATWCLMYDIPPIYRDASALLRGEYGITTHAQAEIAFPYHGHTDPGPNFPIDYYIALVHDYMEHDTDMTPAQLGYVKDPYNGTDVWGVWLLNDDLTTYTWYSVHDATQFIHQELKMRRLTG